MTILAGDIKLVASRVMDDVPEGGGAPTSVVIADGASNAIFSDISELDRAGGDVSFRKVFVHVQTDNTDTYLGSNLIVAEPPTDPNVSVTLFSTAQTFDERASASGRVESYLVAGPEWPGYLLENHITGQRAIQLFQRPEEGAPDIGETLVLIYKEGLVGERIQYVRVIDTAVVLRTYTDPNTGKTYQANNVTCDLSDPLRYDFPGSPPSPYFVRDTSNGTKTRETSVGDAATYAGVSKTTAAVEIGDVALNVDSIFTQLVPSAQTEIPLADQSAAGQSTAVTRAADGTISYSTVLPFNSETSLSLGNPIVPGTLVITAGSATLTDTGGQLFDGATVVGVVDYARGTVSFPTLAAPYNGTKTVAFEPAAAPLRVADTAQIPVTPASRSFNYITTVVPPPAPGTAQVSFRSQGRWYDLRDNGGGVLRGSDSTFGIGTVNYVSGTISVTLGALPDDGSSVLFAWGSQVNYINRSDMTVPNPSVSMQLPDALVQPDTVTITWNDGSARTASDDGKGVISGDATGTVDYESGRIQIAPTVLPAGGQEYAVAYSLADVAAEQEYVAVAPVREADTTIIVDLGATNITPGTVRMEWPILPDPPNGTAGVQDRDIPPNLRARDNGLGSIIDDTSRVAGTIDYVTGIISFQPNASVTGTRKTYTWVSGNGYIGSSGGFVVPTYRESAVNYQAFAAVMPATGNVTVKFQAGGTPTAETPVVFTANGVKFDITNRYGEQIVPGSINFLMGGRRYFDRLGLVFTDLEVATGAALSAGTINYSTGEIVISEWTPGAANSVAVNSLLTTTGDHTVGGATFRVPVSPVRPGSLQILATKVTGGTLNVTAALDGTITDAGMRGNVDYETGVVGVEFGAMVTAAGRESELWYRAEDVVGGMIWEPMFVFSDTIRFNAVAFSYLPLDAAILGLDPVRLPQDGRVPIFRPGGFAVLGHTKTSAPATVANAQVIDLARVRLSRVRVVGDDGETIVSGYTADLEAGTITFTDVTGYSQPVTIEDRIEDMAQISDVQINGALAFTRPITHDYPIGSYMSSALISNDLKSRVSIFFDQGSWDSITWLDTLDGAAATGTYNNTLAPPVVTNRGAVTERWALKFTSSTGFQVIGEHVGVIEVGTINTDCAPINPATGTPYFTLSALGWGIGWAAGNVLRLNTVGAMFPAWIVRTVQQGAESVQDDKFTILVRGDVDRP